MAAAAALEAMAWHGDKGKYAKPLEITARRMVLTGLQASADLLARQL